MARSKTPFALPIPLLDFDRSFGPQRLRIFQQFARMARSKTPLPCPSHFWILIGLLAPDASEFSAFERLKRSRRHFLPGHAPFLPILRYHGCKNHLCRGAGTAGVNGDREPRAQVGRRVAPTRFESSSYKIGKGTTDKAALLCSRCV